MQLFSSSKVILSFIRSPSWCSVAKSCLTLWPHGLQHARLPRPSLSPGVCSDSRPLSQWCHPTISSSVAPLLLLPSLFSSVRVFSSESALFIRWPKYWSFSFCISPSDEYSGLISFRIDWFDLLAVQGTLKSFQHHSSKASVLQCLAFFMVQFSHLYMTAGKISFDYMDLCRQYLLSAKHCSKLFTNISLIFMTVVWRGLLLSQTC